MVDVQINLAHGIANWSNLTQIKHMELFELMRFVTVAQLNSHCCIYPLSLVSCIVFCLH